MRVFNKPKAVSPHITCRPSNSNDNISLFSSMSYKYPAHDYVTQLGNYMDRLIASPFNASTEETVILFLTICSFLFLDDILIRNF